MPRTLSAVAVGANLLSNPSFEVDTSGWDNSTVFGSIARDTSRFHSGVASGLVTPPGFSGSGPTIIIDGGGLGMAAGGSYRFTVWVYIPSPGGVANFRVSARIVDSDGASVSDNPQLVNEWEQLSVTHTVSDTATEAWVEIIHFGHGAGVFFVDDAFFGPAPLTAVANPVEAREGFYPTDYPNQYPGFIWGYGVLTADTIEVTDGLYPPFYP